MPWNVDRSIAYLNRIAFPPYGRHQCEPHVRRGLAVGGVNVALVGNGYGKDFGRRLTGAMGFTFVISQVMGETYLKGDIAVIDGFPANGGRSANPYGHVALFDGTNWISDFVQDRPTPYPGPGYRAMRPRIDIYRLVG